MTFAETIKNDVFQSYIGVKCDIELNDWNDDANNVYVLSRDDNFLYYLKDDGSSIGALGIQYIENIKKCHTKTTNELDSQNPQHIDKNYFSGKTANVSLHEKHFWSGILGKETEYLEIAISELNDTHLCFLKGACNEQNIPIEQVSKIEIV